MTTENIFSLPVLLLGEVGIWGEAGCDNCKIDKIANWLV